MKADPDRPDGRALPTGLRAALSDLRWILSRHSLATGRGVPFNILRTTELAWRRFGPVRSFDRTSDLRLDVVIPLADADREVLPVSVASVRRNLAHPLGTIYAVTRAGSLAAETASELGCTVIDEDSLLPLRRADIDYRVGTMDRSGWLFQQLIKLSADAIAVEDHILLLDADTVLVRPQSFTLRGEIVLLQSGEYHGNYFSACEDVLGIAPSSHLSFIAHHMVVNRRSLAALKHEMELGREVAWWQAILNVCDLSCASCFSEYELYGNFELRRRSVPRRWWMNAALPRDRLLTIENLEWQLGSRYRTVSFHHYV